ncbi:hypothetical protein SAMN05216203_2931 [Marinobacter daqiaonensis]|uniref:Protein nucleotidyltransferase YdiU n=1 Tax=Marinobacter daqiaonensis TaxID=650891 RepID=A0A1I6JF14_9GAMM|nr:YdiU family protein [Marinobacter daqiaonensis]SFR77190.1 hypothetical protein SAMN05216203_2931 [Marinobacter daqiaonensis]
MASFSGIRTRQRYRELPETFYTPVRPTPLRGDIKLVHFNTDLAREMGLDTTSPEDWTEVGAGRALLAGMDPVAMKYTGHQFGMYNPDLGDGRGLLLWETEDPDGRIRDWHLKGAGQTPYSRFGDGRAVLRSTIREYLCSEAMHHLGIPTTRALFLVSSREPVRRETLETAAAMLRVADTHIRFGHFEYAAHSLGPEAVKTLADHTIRHHFRELTGLPENERYTSFFAEVTRRTARMVAQWQGVGFCHGVMNSDNMSIIGDTFDYGPYAFLDDFDAGYICNHTDQQGRYAYNRQPGIGFVNCQLLARSLISLIDEDDLRRALREYETTYNETFLELMRQKLGLEKGDENDLTLIMDTFSMLHEHRVDYTLFFRGLSRLPSRGATPVRDLFVDRKVADEWLARYGQRLQDESRSASERETAMCGINPKFILRNYLAQQVILEAGEGDYQPLTDLLNVLKRPFDEQPENEHYAAQPPDWGRHMNISCSS